MKCVTEKTAYDNVIAIYIMFSMRIEIANILRKQKFLILYVWDIINFFIFIH